MSVILVFRLQKTVFLGVLTGGLLASGGCAIAEQSAAASSGSGVTPSGESWQRHADNPVLPVGRPIQVGGAIASATSDPSVLFDDKSRKWKMWFTAAYPEAGHDRVGIQYAESADGFDWITSDGLAFGPSESQGAWDGASALAPTVIELPEAPPQARYLMWYAGAGRQPDGRPGPASIGMATSPDGRQFTRVTAFESPYHKPGLVLMAKDAFPGKPGVVSGSVTDPDAVWQEGRIHLWFTATGLDRGGRPLARGLGHALSRDGALWRPSRLNPLPSLVRPGGLAIPTSPSVIFDPDGNDLEMWYSADRANEPQGAAGVAAQVAAQVAARGAAFAAFAAFPDRGKQTLGYWHATSRDGENWKTEYARGRDFAWDQAIASEAAGAGGGPEVVHKDSETRLYYPAAGSHKLPTAWTSSVGRAINVAVRHGQ